MENEVLKRVPKAVHLRTAGFDVIEAADGEEARRVLDSVPVNVVFADLAMPDQTNGLAFLRWLRKHHPAIKTIVTSGTETNMPLEGYGMFLSKPYRLADLDYCLQKVLAPLRIAASETGGATTADPSSIANDAASERFRRPQRVTRVDSESRKANTGSSAIQRSRSSASACTER